MLNGYEVDATVDEQERMILSMAAGELTRNAFVNWLNEHTTTN